MIPENIHNIIFDLGGVIIHLDTARTSQALADLAGKPFEEVHNLCNQEMLFRIYERGEIGPPAFLKGLRELLQLKAGDAEIIEAWNAMLLQFPPENLELLRRLKEEGRYRLFLLSNTNLIHIEEVHRRLQQACGEKDFSNFFHKVYYSQDIGARKPEPESYGTILREWNLKPEETLFIDDNQGNILGAQRLAIKTFHFPLNGNLPAVFGYGS